MMHLVVIIALFFSFSAVARDRKPDADDLLTGCPPQYSSQYCEVMAAEFRKWYPLAWRGDYQGWRNVAYCLSTGCDGSVVQSKINGCAWRLFIVNSRNRLVDNTDVMAVKTWCGRLDDYERSEASQEAEKIRQKMRR